MNQPTLTRSEILSTLRRALEPLDFVHAMWEGGAAAFDRVDEWSDIDLQFDVDDDCVEETFDIVEATLAALSPIDLKYRIPEPTWHGHSQVFYRLVDAGPFLLIDLSVSKRSSRDKFLQREVHGNPVAHFDKSNVVQSTPLDRDAFTARLRERVTLLRLAFDLNRPLVLKELNRGNSIEALSFYHGFMMRPLLEALRIMYKPARHGFHTRYVHYDFPPEIVARLESLFYVANMDDLRAKRDEVDAWFHEITERIDFDDVKRRLGQDG